MKTMLTFTRIKTDALDGWSYSHNGQHYHDCSLFSLEMYALDCGHLKIKEQFAVRHLDGTTTTKTILYNGPVRH